MTNKQHWYLVDRPLLAVIASRRLYNALVEKLLLSSIHLQFLKGYKGVSVRFALLKSSTKNDNDSQRVIFGSFDQCVLFQESCY